MNPAHEDSLLFSLAELRAIEDARIAEEQHAERAAKEAAIAARAAEQARVEHERAEQRRIESLERERIEREIAADKEREERRERLAVEERERLARVAAEERLARERLALESVPRSASRLPLVVGGAVAVAAIILAVLYVNATTKLDASEEARAATNVEMSALGKERDQLREESQAAAQTIQRLKGELATARASSQDRTAAAGAKPGRTGRSGRASRAGRSGRADSRRDRETSDGGSQGGTSADTISLPTCDDPNSPLCGLKSGRKR